MFNLSTVIVKKLGEEASITFRRLSAKKYYEIINKMREKDDKDETYDYDLNFEILRACTKSWRNLHVNGVELTYSDSDNLGDILIENMNVEMIADLCSFILTESSLSEEEKKVFNSLTTAKPFNARNNVKVKRAK